MKQYFIYQESTNRGYTIALNWNLWKFSHAPREGSYTTIAARMSGLSWANWLRYCQQNGATLYGKNNFYPVAIWKEPNEKFIKELNERASAIFEKFKMEDINL